MSMIGHVRQITPAQLAEFRKNPSALGRFLHGGLGGGPLVNIRDINAIVQKIAAEARQTGAFADPAKRDALRVKMMHALQDAGAKIPAEILKTMPPGDRPTQAASDAEPADAREEGLSLDKSWHALHYLLTGHAEEAPPPLGNAILGGTELGEDMGYGPARFLTPEEVRATSNALNKLSADDLAGRCDLPTMIAAEIYACREEGDLGLAQEYFSELVRYYADAATRGNAMLLYLD
jgi:hypothetical protein